MALCRSKVSRRARLALAPLTALFLSDVGHAAPPTAITTCPFLITTPGQYYLAVDLTCPPGDGIRSLAVDNVNLNLNGHTLQGLSFGAGIIAQGSKILIQGPGTITGFGDGLEFINVTLSKVIQVTATRNSSTGFVVIGGTDNVFQGNVAALNGHEGISIIFSSENKIVNNRVMNNDAGIDVTASLNKIHANTATSNRFTGISVRGTQNEINGNTALGNLVEDMVDNTTLEANCDGNRWEGNRFDTANQSCIR